MSEDPLDKLEPAMEKLFRRLVLVLTIVVGAMLTAHVLLAMQRASN